MPNYFIAPDVSRWVHADTEEEAQTDAQLELSALGYEVWSIDIVETEEDENA